MNFERKTSIIPQEANNLNPIEKFEKYGRFPSEMIAHILLVIFTTCQIILIVGEKNNFSRSQEHLIYNMFLDQSDKRDVDYAKKIYLYSPEEIRNHVNNSLNNFFNIKEKSLELVEFTNDDLYSILEFSYLNPNKINYLMIEGNSDSQQVNNQTMNNTNIERSFLYKVTNQFLGPFSYDDNRLKLFLNDVVEFRMNYTFKTYVPVHYYDYYACNLWAVHQFYNFASRGHFTVRLNINRLGCEDLNIKYSFLNLFINKLIWIHLIIIFLAIYSIMKTWTLIKKAFDSYLRFKSEYDKAPSKDDVDSKEEESNDSQSKNNYRKIDSNHYYNPLLPSEIYDKQLNSFDSSSNPQGNDEDENSFISKDNEIFQKNKAPEKQITNLITDDGYKNMDDNKEEPKILNIINWWQIFCLIGNIIQIFACGLSIFDQKTLFQSTEILVGFGVMFAYFNMGRYIEYANNYSIFYVIIQNSLPRVSRYLIGVTPVFLGFIFFGLSVFWRSERFTSFSDVMIILFSLAQGDSVFDAFKDVSGLYFFMGQVYLYSFCILFIVVVLNIFIALIEESYVNSRMENKTHWVFDYIMNQDKENNQDSNKDKKTDNNFSENLDNKKSNIKNSNSKEKQTFIIKDPRHKEKFASASLNNNNYPKSLNLKAFVSKENDEAESLSYKKHFNLKMPKTKSYNNLKEINYSLNNYNSSYNNSFSLTNFNQNNFDSNKLTQNSKEKLNINVKKEVEIEMNKMLPPNSETPTNLPIGKKFNTLRSRENQNPLLKKRVSFSNINQIISDDTFSNIKTIPNKNEPLISINNNNNNNNINHNPPSLKKILKKEEHNKDNSKDILKQGSLIDLYNRERIQKELNHEFQRIFDDLDYLKKYSQHTMANAPASIIDDLRVAFLDFTINLESKKNLIENNFKKNGILMVDN